MLCILVYFQNKDVFLRKETNIMENRIREILESKNISATELSEKVGISRVNIYNIINNKQQPSANTLEALAKALDVEFWELFCNPSTLKSRLVCPHCGKEIEIIVKAK